MFKASKIAKNMSLLRILLSLTCLIAAAQASAQASLRNILLDEEQGLYNPCEPSIAISPRNPDHIVAGAILNRCYASSDGGKTWAKQYLGSPYGVFGDPCLIADKKGYFYYFHLSNPSGRGWSDPGLLDRIVVQRSKDAGRSWSEGSYLGLNPPRDQDKEWAVADPRSGRLYATWTQFDKYESRDTADKTHIYFSASAPGGQKWSAPLRISQYPGDCLDDDATVEGAVPAVGPEGQVYVAWALNERIYFDRSTDGGRTWLAEDRVVAAQPGGWALDIPGISRCNGMPVTACDLSPGPYRGRIYVNWADQRNGSSDTDIWLAWSEDQGETWSAPLRVNDDAPGRQQFLPWLAVDPVSGFLYCVFYDRRAHEGLQTDVYIAWSEDGGRSFRNRHLSETSFLPTKSVFFGDYNNIAAYGGRICPIWTRMDSRKTSIWTAVIRHEDLAR
jgi:hypothetical protein